MQNSFVLKETESRQNQPYNILGMDVYLKVSGNDTGGQLSMFMAEYTKNQGPPLHLHNVDETFYITAGEFLFQMGDKKCKVTAGDTLFIPRAMPHTFLTISDKGKMIFMVNPTDTVEILFGKLSAYQEMPPIEEVIRVHEEMGLKIVGPPLTSE